MKNIKITILLLAFGLFSGLNADQLKDLNLPDGILTVDQLAAGIKDYLCKHPYDGMPDTKIIKILAQEHAQKIAKICAEHVPPVDLTIKNIRVLRFEKNKDNRITPQGVVVAGLLTSIAGGALYGCKECVVINHILHPLSILDNKVKLGLGVMALGAYFAKIYITKKKIAAKIAHSMLELSYLPLLMSRTTSDCFKRAFGLTSADTELSMVTIAITTFLFPLIPSLYAMIIQKS